jgi:hypothetical protein
MFYYNNKFLFYIFFCNTARQIHVVTYIYVQIVLFFRFFIKNFSIAIIGLFKYSNSCFDKHNI